MFVGTNLETSVKERRGLHLQISNSNKKKKKKKKVLCLPHHWIKNELVQWSIHECLIMEMGKGENTKIWLLFKGKNASFLFTNACWVFGLIYVSKGPFFFLASIYIYIYMHAN